VLVVDDDDSILAVLVAILTGEGYRVVTADGGREAVQRAAQLGASIVLLDMRMPELDGWGVARELAARGLRPKIVIMSALSDRLDQIADEIGAVAYLSKPFDVDAVIETIRNVSTS
jgi:two-component system NtrC family response regulator/two-component system response regulator PilR (NtrC family)